MGLLDKRGFIDWSWEAAHMGGTGIAVSPKMPFAAGAQLWYDFSDLSTLFQTADTSTPVTADGQFLGRVNNKGLAAAGECIQSTAGDRPKWLENALTFNGTVFGGYTPDTDELEYLTASPTGHGADSGDFAVFWVAVNATDGDSKYMFSWEGSTDTAEMRVDDSNVQQLELLNGGWEGAVAAGDGELIAGWGADDGAGAQTIRFHGEAVIVTADSSDGPASGAPFIIGNNDATPIAESTWAGQILELVVTVGDYANRALWETYTARKYGVTWV